MIKKPIIYYIHVKNTNLSITWKEKCPVKRGIKGFTPTFSGFGQAEQPLPVSRRRLVLTSRRRRPLAT